MIILDGVPGIRQRTHHFLQLADDFILIFTGAAAFALRLLIKLCDILCAGNCCVIEPSKLLIGIICLIKGDGVPSELSRLDHGKVFNNQTIRFRIIHLCDTFEGFSSDDVRIEQEHRLSGARVGDYSETAKDLVEKRLRYREKALFYKGYFPDTFSLCTAEEFAFVSIDADLYAPTAAALPLFWERLSSGGVLLVHDVNSLQYTGAGKAVREFCREERILPIPVCDLHGSVILRKDWKT